MLPFQLVFSLFGWIMLFMNRNVISFVTVLDLAFIRHFMRSYSYILFRTTLLNKIDFEMIWYAVKLTLNKMQSISDLSVIRIFYYLKMASLSF